jgi:hypothetical protein
VEGKSSKFTTDWDNGRKKDVPAAFQGEERLSVACVGMMEFQRASFHAVISGVRGGKFFKLGDTS